MAWLTERNWRTLAACRSFDPDLFFPVSSAGKSLEQVEARAVCASCLVRRQCLAFALRTRQAHGIWGGLTAQERDQRYPARTAAAPPRTAELAWLLCTAHPGREQSQGAARS